MEKKCLKTDYANLATHMNEKKEVRNVKLFKAYQREWTRHEDIAKNILAKKIKGDANKKAFEEKRLSIQELGEKNREKQEMKEVVEVLQDHTSVNFWEANLRQFSTSKNALVKRP